MIRLLLLCILGVVTPLLSIGQSELNLSSPDGYIQLTIKTTDFLEIQVMADSVMILDFSRFSLSVEDEQVLGLNPKIKKKELQRVDGIIFPVVAEKSKQIRELYNELSIRFKGDYRVNFRVYNEGVAWQFETFYKDKITVNREQLMLNFPEGSNIWFPEEQSLVSHNERYYLHEPISMISSHRFCSLPALVEPGHGLKVLVSESNLRDYPGMWLKGTGTPALRALFPGMAIEEEQDGDRNVKVTEYAEYLAITDGERKFPWRMLAIAKSDAELLTNQLSYLLADTCRIADPSWIKPGKVAWDWWNAWNIYGVDFEAGVNTETYKYYIDFASANGLEYIIMDEGWYVLGDLLKVVPEIDMEAIIAYGKERNVDVVLWVVWKTLEDQWEAAFDQFEQWGVKGIKVDFMQRDDQWMVNYYWRVAEEAADRKMLVDFHGSYKPTGLRRVYPNVISREGVRGLEQSKWSEGNTPDHNLTIPFIRMIAGPMDYTPGAMVNGTKEHFRDIYTQPMSMGTRCHQLAMYVIYESPLQMLCDNPSNYMAEPECMEFLSAVPTVWDTTVVLMGAIAEHVAIARKKDNHWYVGCMTNWDPRELELDFSFLGPGKHKMDTWRDGVNADRYGSDYKKESMMISSDETLTVKLAPGGGWVAIIHEE